MRTVFLVLLPFSAGYFLSYLYRTVNSVIGGDLVKDIGLSAGDIGLLTSVYLLTEQGRDLRRIFEAVEAWNRRWLTDPDAVGSGT